MATPAASIALGSHTYGGWLDMAQSSGSEFSVDSNQQALVENGTYTRPGDRPMNPFGRRRRDRHVKAFEESRPMGARVRDYMRETYLAEVYGDTLIGHVRTLRPPVWPPLPEGEQNANTPRPLSKDAADKKLEEFVARFGPWCSQNKSLVDIEEPTDALMEVVKTVRQHAAYKKHYAEVPPKEIEGTGSVFLNALSAAEEVGVGILINRTQIAILNERFSDALRLIMEAHGKAKSRLNYLPLTARCWYWTGIIAHKLGVEKLAASAFFKAQPCCGHYVEGEQLLAAVEKYKDQMVQVLQDNTTFGRPAHEWADLLFRAASNGEPIFMASPVQLSPDSAQKMHVEIHGGQESPVAAPLPPARQYRRQRVQHTPVASKDSSSSWPREWSPIQQEDSASLGPEEAEIMVARWISVAELAAGSANRQPTPIIDSPIVASSDHPAGHTALSGAITLATSHPSPESSPRKPMPSPTMARKTSWRRIRSLKWKGKPFSSSDNGNSLDSHLPSPPLQRDTEPNPSSEAQIKKGIMALLTRPAGGGVGAGQPPMSPTSPKTPSPLRASVAVDEGEVEDDSEQNSSLYNRLQAEIAGG